MGLIISKSENIWYHFEWQKKIQPQMHALGACKNVFRKITCFEIISLKQGYFVVLENLTDINIWGEAFA